MITYTMKVDDEEIAIIKQLPAGVTLELRKAELSATEALALRDMLNSVDWDEEDEE